MTGDVARAKALIEARLAGLGPAERARALAAFASDVAARFAAKGDRAKAAAWRARADAAARRA